MASGMSLQQILDMTLSQIMLSAKCIMRHKVSMIEMVMEPIAAGLGSKKAKRSLEKKKAKAMKSKNPNKKLSPERKDALLLNKLKMMGFNVN